MSSAGTAHPGAAPPTARPQVSGTYPAPQQNSDRRPLRSTCKAPKCAVAGGKPPRHCPKNRVNPVFLALLSPRVPVRFGPTTAAFQGAHHPEGRPPTAQNPRNSGNFEHCRRPLTTDGPPMGVEPMTPVVASIVNFNLPMVVPGLCWCERRATMDGTEESAIVAQFNEFLMSRLHSSTVSDQCITIPKYSMPRR